MPDFFVGLFSDETFMPHGHCYLWLPEILWLHVVSDAVIAIAYFSIPVALVYLVRRRRDLAFNWMFIMFGVFILACGCTHLMGIWTVWQPVYRLEGVVKAITAISSISTAYLIWPLLPKVIALPTTRELELANLNLKKEIEERMRVENELFTAKSQLEKANLHLNMRVAEGVLKVIQSEAAIKNFTVKLEESELALALSEKRFQILSEQIPQLVWMSDPSGQTSHFNSRWAEYLGLPMENLSKLGWMAGIHPDDLKETQRLWDLSIATGKTFETEYRILSKENQYRWHLGRALPLKDQKDVVLQWYGTSTDIDDQKRTNDLLEERVRDRTALLVEANQELEAFSYSVSHDLRSPLRHICGFAEILNRRAMSQLDPTSQRHLMTIWNSAERAGRLVDELLNFSRLGRLEIKRDLVPLRDVVVDARAQVESEAERKFKVDWRIEELSDVVGDRSMLLLVFVNLLSNAIKYSMNSASPTIRIYQPSSPTEVIVAVADNGIGFDMAYVDKLFGIFQRLHVPGEFDGIGIGLANVKRIVTKHGGRVWAEGKPGEGATFYVALPKN